MGTARKNNARKCLTRFKIYDILSGTAGGVMLVPSRRARRSGAAARVVLRPTFVGRRSPGIQPGERRLLPPSDFRWAASDRHSAYRTLDA